MGQNKHIYPKFEETNLEIEVLKFWNDNKIFEKSIYQNKEKENYVFYEGPPGANGQPGIHHVLSRTIKDIIARYKTMQGYCVERKAGWDTHGLPVELSVEKKLGIKKEDIGKKISIKDYNKECHKTVLKYKNDWDHLTQKIGYWVDLQNPYMTLDNDYIESVWNILKTFFDKNLLYKGYSIQPYSPAAGTGLSSHELNLPGCYKNVKDTSIVAQFKLKNFSNRYFLAWTTTPWTLPANSALAIGEKIDYVTISTFNRYTFEPIEVILAKDTINLYFDSQYEVKGKKPKLYENSKSDLKIEWSVIEQFKGKDLLGMKYEQLMPYVIPEGKAFEVISGDFVTTEDGTGIVHISPTFGADDKKAADKAGITPITVYDESGHQIPIVKKTGQFVKEITDFADMYVKKEYENITTLENPEYKSIDIQIAIKLKKENKAFLVQTYEHNYPHCWRTDKPILYYPLDSWFIKTTDLKKELIDLNKTINWIPQFVGEGRFGNWLENLVDWNLSRDRFWGIPLPIWKSSDGRQVKCIGSIEELKSEIKKSIEIGYMKNEINDFDLHKPYVDEIILVGNNGQKLYREKDVIDVWFDSGAMPYASLHYPFENQENFKKRYPADFIAEGIDQTRGWFFTLHAISVLMFKKVAFKNVIVNGLVLDKDGNKMSKRLGNSVDPLKIIEKYGADVLRLYMISNSNPWENLKFDEEELIKIKRKFFNTLQNTYAFFALYANIDDFDYIKYPNFQNLTEIDRWILSKLNSLIKKVTELLDNYDITTSARIIQKFTVDDLSNWYVRLNRKRFWKSENSDDKTTAYQILHYTLVSISKLMAPFIPFYSEKLFKNLTLNRNESIHLTTFPKFDTKYIDLFLEKNMSLAQTISSLVHSIRKNEKIKVRQPLSKLIIPLTNEVTKDNLKSIEDLILHETNIKQLEYIDKNNTFIKKQIKPNFPKLGKIFGKKMKEVSQLISNLSEEEINKLENNQIFEIEIGNEKYNLTIEDVIISTKDIPGWAIAKEGLVTVALDISIDKELYLEGIQRELINKIQNLRKDKNLDVQDKIKIYFNKINLEDKIYQSIKKYQQIIKQETQCLEIIFEEDKYKYDDNIQIDNKEVYLKIEKF